MEEIVTREVAPHVIGIGMNRPPANYFDEQLIRSIADALDEVDQSPHARAAVLYSLTRHFCAGADLQGRAVASPIDPKEGASRLYAQALRLFNARTPIVAAVGGAAIGGGLGLAMVADFRVASTRASFSANFSRLGFFPGFGLTASLPRVIGHQHANRLFYTGERISAARAFEIGLVDQLSEEGQELDSAIEFAREIALSSPRSVALLRRTFREAVLQAVESAIPVENAHQISLMTDPDFAEGIQAASERRLPNFRDEEASALLAHQSE
jgi:enoyl-CoA hydratase/carnithine racemase